MRDDEYDQVLTTSRATRFLVLLPSPFSFVCLCSALPSLLLPLWIYAYTSNQAAEKVLGDSFYYSSGPINSLVNVRNRQLKSILYPTYILLHTLFFTMPRVINSTSRDRLSENLTSLLTSLKTHPLYEAPNPAVRGKIHFVCQFINSSKKRLDRLDSKKLDAQDANETAGYNEVVQRCIFTQVLINDMTRNATNLNGEDPALTIDFGGDVKAKVEMLVAQSDFAQ